MFLPYRKLVNKTFITSLRNLSTSKTLWKNHYEVLGVDRDANQAEIKNAYFKLTKLYHPDKIAATDENLKKFREISEAYEVLGNDHSRKLYDKGFLSDAKRVGSDAVIVDPVIAFYKQRQNMASILHKKPDIWTQSHFSEAKRKSQHDLFSMKTTGGLQQESILMDLKGLLFMAFVGFLFFLNFEHSCADHLWNDIINLFKF